MEGTYSDLTTTADKLIKILKPLADNHHLPNGNWFLAVMEGIYRRNYVSPPLYYHPQGGLGSGWTRFTPSL